MKTLKLPSFTRTAALFAAGFSSAMFYAEAASAFVILGLGNKCADIVGGAVTNGTPVQLFICNGAANQQWNFNSDGTIRNPASGKCLTASGNAVANSTPMVIFTCVGSTSQKWSLEANGSIRGLASGKCLDLPNASIVNNTPINLFPCNEALNQAWSFVFFRP